MSFVDIADPVGKGKQISSPGGQAVNTQWGSQVMKGGFIEFCSLLS